MLESMNMFRAKRALSAAYGVVAFVSTSSGVTIMLAPLLSMALCFAAPGPVRPLELRLWQAAGAGLAFVVGPLASTLRVGLRQSCLKPKPASFLCSPGVCVFSFV